MNRHLRIAIIAVGAFALLTPAAWATPGFNVFGGYATTDQLDETGGGGLSVTMPLGNNAGFKLRGTYFQQLTSDEFDETIDRSFDPDNDEPDVFQENTVEAVPLDAGLTWSFNPEESFSPYVGAGVTWFLLDVELAGPRDGNLDDEFGYFAEVGANFAGREDWGFFAEALYRNAEGTFVREGPQGDNVDAIGDPKIDLSGFGVNAGVVWRF